MRFLITKNPSIMLLVYTPKDWIQLLALISNLHLMKVFLSILWSDRFDPNGLKKNKNNVWLYTLTLNIMGKNVPIQLNYVRKKMILMRFIQNWSTLWKIGIQKGGKFFVMVQEVLKKFS